MEQIQMKQQKVTKWQSLLNGALTPPPFLSGFDRQVEICTEDTYQSTHTRYYFLGHALMASCIVFGILYLIVDKVYPHINY